MAVALSLIVTESLIMSVAVAIDMTVAMALAYNHGIPVTLSLCRTYVWL